MRELDLGDGLCIFFGSPRTPALLQTLRPFSRRYALTRSRTLAVVLGRPIGEKSRARVSARRLTSGSLLLKSLSLYSLCLNGEVRNAE